jgi:hypothetical protein
MTEKPSDSLAARLGRERAARGSAPGGVIEAEREEGEPTSAGHTAAARNRRREFDSLDVYHAKGCTTLQYVYLLTIESDEDGQMVLEFTSRHVMIEGKRLGLLRTQLSQRQVAELHEVARPEFDGTENEPIIHRITVVKPGGGEAH